jgi:hypothetical protein
VFFIPADTSIAVEASDEGLQLWLAGVNSQVFARGAAMLLLLVCGMTALALPAPAASR